MIGRLKKIEIMEFTYSIASKEYVLYIPTFFHIGSYFEIRGHNVRIQISIKGLIFASYSMLPKFIIIKFFLQRVRPVYSNSVSYTHLTLPTN